MAAQAGDVVNLFNQIAPVYDRLNRIISWGKDQSWRLELARRMDLKPGQSVLDISAGTGDMEVAIKEVCPQVNVIGLDPSRRMVDLYRAKISRASVVLGMAEFIPARSDSITRAVCAFGLRNFQDRSAAFREINRVLVPGGLWGFLEMSAPEGFIFPLIYGLYFKRIVPLLGAVFAKNFSAYRYLRDTVYQFPDKSAITTEHARAGFSLLFYRPVLRGAVVLYIFKKNPISLNEDGSSR